MGYKSCIVIGLLALPIAGCLVPVTSLSGTCVICRKYRLERTYAGIPLNREAETNCSRWYATNVEPRHDHLWERGTCRYESDFWGFTRSVGCRPGHYPIFLLSPNTQLAVYKHFKNPLDAKALFADLTDEKTHDDRLDEHDEDKGHLIVDALGKWETEGFTGDWNVWWGKEYAKHVEEHKRWVEWFEADSHVDFDTWQKSRQR